MCKQTHTTTHDCNTHSPVGSGYAVVAAKGRALPLFHHGDAVLAHIIGRVDLHRIELLVGLVATRAHNNVYKLVGAHVEHFLGRIIAIKIISTTGTTGPSLIRCIKRCPSLRLEGGIRPGLCAIQNISHVASRTCRTYKRVMPCHTALDLGE